MGKVIVLREKATGLYKFYVGSVQDFKLKSYPGYSYVGSYASPAQARERIALSTVLRGGRRA